MTAIPGQHPHPDSAALSDTVVLRCLLGTVADYPDDPVEWGDLDAIARLWSGDGIREAVLLASLVRAAQVEKLLVPSGTDTPVKKRKRLHKALLKYAVRLSSRRTPFGMFAETGYDSMQSSDYRLALQSWNGFGISACASAPAT